MTIREFLKTFDEVAPLSLAMEGDPVGTQVCAEDSELTGIAVAYELHEALVRRIEEAGANLVIAFHPLIFPSLSTVTDRTRVERTVVELIDRRIALHVLHTAFDAHPRGTSRLFLEALGAEKIEPMRPDPEQKDAGMGSVGTMPSSISIRDLIGAVKEISGADVVRSSVHPDTDRTVQRVALLGGSGSSFYEDAVRAGAEIFITGDNKYHAFHAANDAIPLLDPGHAETERFVVPGMAALVREATSAAGIDLPVTEIDADTNPVNYIC